jgi:hypothetical protein
MNEDTETSPNTIQGLAFGVSVPAWSIVAPGPPIARPVTLDIPVPYDFVNSSTDTLVTVAFDTNNSITASGTVDLELDTTATPSGGTIGGLFATTYTQTVPVTTPGSPGAYNYYTATFQLNQTFAGPGDNLLLSVTRFNTGDTFGATIYLTGISFRYATS